MAENLILHPFFTNIILPFIFTFVLIYALLEKINLLANKQAHLIVALAMSFFFIGVPALLNITSIIIPTVSILVIIGFCLMLVFGILGIKFYEAEKSALKGWIAAILIIIGIIVIANMLGVFSDLAPKLTPELISTIAFIVIAGVVVYVLVAFKPATSK